jgi:transposase InsO family protein
MGENKDQGVQYAANEYVEILKDVGEDVGARMSMAAVGEAWQNVEARLIELLTPGTFASLKPVEREAGQLHRSGVDVISNDSLSCLACPRR